jgi:hypothetical protein
LLDSLLKEMKMILKDALSLLVFNFMLIMLFSVGLFADESPDLFLQLFLSKRREQLLAVKNILSLDASKQKVFLDQVTAKMGEVMARSKVRIESSGYIPGDGFPTDEPLRDALSLLLENSCLFCDIALRFPDDIHQRLDAHRELDLTLRWSVGYVKDLQVLDESTRKLLHLCAQEINLLDRDPEYQNPYRIKRTPQKRFEEPPPVSKKPRKKLARGPKMSKTEL